MFQIVPEITEECQYGKESHPDKEAVDKPVMDVSAERKRGRPTEATEQKGLIHRAALWSSFQETSTSKHHRKFLYHRLHVQQRVNKQLWLTHTTELHCETGDITPCQTVFIHPNSVLLGNLGPNKSIGTQSFSSLKTQEAVF